MNAKEKPLCEGIQHTRAIIAIGIIQYCIDTYQPKPESFMAKLLAIIQKRIDEVCVQTKKRMTSRCSLRALRKYIDLMTEETVKEYANEDDYYRAWNSICVAAFQYLEEVRTSCPIYWQGKYKRSWLLLLRMFEYLVGNISEHSPESEEYGALFYLKLSDAVEAV